MNIPKEYYFKKGNTFGKGRPPKVKNQIERIRSRILRVVRRRIMHETNLNTVSTTELLKFLASIMPKDFGLAIQAPQITYISNVPRETDVELTPGSIQSLPDKSEVEEQPVINIEQQQPAVPQL